MRHNGKVLPEKFLKRMPPADRAPLGKAGVTADEATEKFTYRHERELQSLIHNELLRQGIWFEQKRMNKRSTGTIGCPDFLFALNGRFCAIEAKLPGCYPDEDQAKALLAIERQGGKVIVARSLQEAKQFIDAIAALPPVETEGEANGD